MGDGTQFMLLLEVEDGGENPLPGPGIPAFAEFRQSLGGRLLGRPVPEHLDRLDLRALANEGV